MRTKGPEETHNRHKVAFSEQAKEAIRISDIVLMLLDCRDIPGSRITEAESHINESGKKIIHVITKIDLLPKSSLDSLDLPSLQNPILISSKTKQGIGKLRERIIIESKKLKQKRKAHITLIAYPNIGKSTLINLLVRRNAAPVSSNPGFTKGLRKIRLNKDISIIDAPGIIRKKEDLFESSVDLRKHSRIGVQIPESVRDPDFLVADIIRLNPSLLEKYYDVEAKGDAEILLVSLAKRHNFMKKQGLPDIDRAARLVLKDFSEGKIRKGKQ